MLWPLASSRVINREAFFTGWHHDNVWQLANVKAFCNLIWSKHNLSWVFKSISVIHHFLNSSPEPSPPPAHTDPPLQLLETAGREGGGISNLKGIHLLCPDVMNCLHSSQRMDHDWLMSFSEEGELVAHVDLGGLRGLFWRGWRVGQV